MSDVIMRLPYENIRLDEMKRRNDVFIRALKKYPPSTLTDVFTCMIQIYLAPSPPGSMGELISTGSGSLSTDLGR